MEPKIRLKGFTGAWKEKPLLDVVTLYNGLTYTPNDIRDRGTLVLRSSNVQEGEISLLDNVYVRSEVATSPNVEKGDIIVVVRNGSRALIGKHAQIKTDMPDTVIGAFMAGMHTDEPEFMNALLCTSRFDNEVAINLGATINQITNGTFRSMKFLFPDKKEQKALGTYFQHLDSLIQSTTKKVESYQQIKAACLQSMFPQEGESSPRVRFKGFEGEWEMVRVGNMGITYSGLTGKTKEDFGSGEARFITFLNVLTNATIDTSILEAVNVKAGEHQNEVKKGDLLFNTSSETPEEVGMCAVMDEDLSDVYLNSFCFGFRVTNENIDSTFIAYLMRSHIGRRIMSILAQGATRYNLSKNNFCNADLLLPKTRKEQSLIANYFVSLDTQIHLQTQRLGKLQQIKSACLDNMFV